MAVKEDENIASFCWDCFGLMRNVVGRLFHAGVYLLFGC